MTVGKERYLHEDYPTFRWCPVYAEHAPISADFVPHYHDFTEVLIIMAGTATHTVGDRTYALKPGDVFVIKEGTVHGFSDVQNVDIINFMYEPNVLLQEGYGFMSIPGFAPLFVSEPEIRQLSRYPLMLTLSEADRQYISHLTDFIIAQLREGNPLHEPSIRMTFYAVASYLAVQYESNAQNLRSAQLLGSIIQFMSNNMDKPLKAPDLAAHAYISTRQLDRVFRTQTNCSPMEYLTKIRLRCAYTLLLNSGAKVSVVAQRCGYSDPSYFTRAFKKVYGIRPHDVAKYMSADE